MYNNVMAELNSDLGSPDARASSGRATSSSGGGSVQVYGRIEGADDVGPWDPSADGVRPQPPLVVCNYLCVGALLRLPLICHWSQLLETPI